MCGICGILGVFSGVEEQEIEIQRMAAVLSHRGPDAWGVYLSPEMALGHTRLSIVDLSGGHQPMATARYVISFNGEIYNHIELREALKKSGVQFETTSDTEVLLRLYEHEGEQAFSKLNGQFAFLIWDRQEKTLLAARDRYGMRPLYMLNHRKKLYFSSEMKSFDTLEGFHREFNPEMLLEHALLWNTLLDDTVYCGIQSLESGTFAVFKDDKCIRKRRYYEIGDTSCSQQNISFERAKEEFEALLQDSVDLRLRSDVPVGAYLSGGIDSSVIAYLAKQRKQDDLETFSVGFEDKAFDESAYQSEVSQSIGSRHAALNILKKNIDESFSEAIYHGERPVFRTAPIPLFLLSDSVTNKNIKVVLTGEGADEYLYGYDTFKELAILSRWKKEPDSHSAPELIRQLYPHLSHYADSTRFGMLKMYYEGFLEHIDNPLAGLNIRLANNQVIARSLNRDWHVDFDCEKLMARVAQQIPAHFSDWTMLQKNAYWEIRTLLQGYLLSSQGDRMSLGHGVEGRYPFLDHRIVDTVFHYPDDFKLKDMSQKHLLRETFRKRVPSSVVERPKRPYMAPDLVSFYKDGNLTPNAAEFLSAEKIAEYGIFDCKFVNRFLKKFERGVPEEIGYRDNMIITFVLSAQISKYWADNPREVQLNLSRRTIRMSDYA